jgi:hypothetical protein
MKIKKEDAAVAETQSDVSGVGGEAGPGEGPSPIADSKIAPDESSSNGGAVGTGTAGASGGSGDAGAPDARATQPDLPIVGVDGSAIDSGGLGGSGGSGDAGAPDARATQPDVPVGGMDGGAIDLGGLGGSSDAGLSDAPGGQPDVPIGGAGGSVGTGGNPGTGGTTTAGGTSAGGTSRGGAGTGGNGAGGSAGASGSAGTTDTGGTKGTGGTASTGGNPGTGGTTNTSGTTSTGGAATGGTSTGGGTGGVGGAIGGTSATGGSCSGTMCGSTCSDLTTDLNNCGACYHACGTGSSCVARSCQAVTVCGGINGPNGLDVSSGYAYFGTTVGVDPTVGRCPVTGCPGTPDYLVSGFSNVIALRAGPDRLFVAGDRAGGDIYDHVYTCTSDGCLAVPTMISTSMGYVSGMHRDDQRVYWWGDNDGTDTDVEYCPLIASTRSDCTRAYHAKSDSVSALTSGAGDIYLSATIGSAVGFYVCTGGDCTNALASVLPLESADQMAYDQAELFWHRNLDYDLYHCTASSCTRSSFFHDQDTIQHLAVDGTGVYFSTYSGLVRACRRSGCVGLPEQIGSVVGEVAALVLDGDFVYWLTNNSGTGVLQRVAKPVLQ